MLIRNARLVSLAEPAPQQLVDVLVEDGVVTGVGVGLASTEGAGSRAAYDDVFDAEGGWLMPGLWDQHVHLAQWTLSSARLDLAPARSAEQAVTLVRERLEEWPDLPVIGWGHRPTAWDEAPVAAHLDAIDTEQPIVLIAGDGHHGWLNTVALQMLALPTRQSVVSEAEWFMAYGRLSTVLGTDGTGPEAYRRTMENAAALGVVGVVDFEFSGGVADWAGRWAGGADVIRVRHACYADGLEDVISRGLRSGDPLDGDRRLTMGPLKIISDGSLNTRTAWCEHAYADGSGHGAANQTPAELRALMSRAAEHGLRTAVHAIGDAACHDAVAAYAETGARGSIEHAQLMTRADVAEMGRLGVVASVQPAHLLDDRDVIELIWPDRADRCFPLRWMVDDGVELALGSDAPVSPLDPWLAMAAAVHRSADDRPAWHPEQAISAVEALAGSVDGRGSVRAGMPADLVLLDADPLDPAGTPEDQAARLRAMPVAATWVDGRLVHGDESAFAG